MQTARALSIQGRLSDDSKKLCLRVLMDFNKKSVTHRLREIMRQFKSNKSIIKYQTQFFNKLMDRTAGKGLKIFNIIKNLPEKINIEKNSKVSRFQRNMANFGMKNLKISY